MKKNYIYFVILIVGTVFLTLFIASLYRKEVSEIAYSYENLNKITATEFKEYLIEHPDTIVYIADKYNLDYNKFEKKLIKKLEKLNLLENVIYIEKEEIAGSLDKTLKEDYSYEYDVKNLPSIIVINDGKIIQESIVTINSNADTIIDYEVFE